MGHLKSSLNRFMLCLLVTMLLPVTSWAGTSFWPSNDTLKVSSYTAAGKTYQVLLINPGAWMDAFGRVEVDTIKSNSGASIVLLGNFIDAAGTQQNFSHVQIDSFSTDSLASLSKTTLLGVVNITPASGTWNLANVTTTVDKDSATAAITSGTATGLTTISGAKVTGTDSLISGLVTNWPTYRYVVAPAGLKRGSYSTIAAALSAAPIGATVFVTNGQYSEAVTIAKRGQRLVGESPDSTIVNGGTTGTALTVTAARVTVENIRLQTDAGAGNNYHGLSGNIDSLTLRNVQIAGADGQGINAAGVGWLLENVFIDNADGYSVAASGLSNSVITNSRFQNSVDAGIYLGGSHRNTVTNNYIISGGTHGIQDNGNKKTIIMGNHISGSGTNAIRIEATSDSLIVIGNVCETNGISGAGTNPKPATLADLNIVP